ncbi:hypothetical protein ACFXD5_11750 [Streptomyces sp. NPDC059385]|uniref:hypothetical protein n=1 Tax=Streptomyces sp. NPDC059385 TaxID=3346817 RepID=UPI0036BF5AB1
MDITAETIEDLYNHGGTITLADGEALTRDQLIQYIDNCDIDTDADGTPLDSQWQILADILGAPDPTNVGELTTIIAAAHRIEAAEKDRDEAIRRAVTAGHQVTAIARAANLSRARIYQIRDGRR